MEYESPKPKPRRPPGKGAFFDYGVALKRRLAGEASGASSRRKKGPAQPEESAEELWDAEGGNSQTRIVRRAMRYERAPDIP